MPVVHQLTAAKRDSANQPDKLQIGELADLDKMSNLPTLKRNGTQAESITTAPRLDSNKGLGISRINTTAPRPSVGTQAEAMWHSGRINTTAPRPNEKIGYQAKVMWHPGRIKYNGTQAE